MLNFEISEAAVRVRGAVKSYGNDKDAQLVLDHLNMTVPKGCIYGLLGASGCGKTTLLSCIAGRLQLNEGELTVLGGVPGTKGSGVPGPRLGYMPQEVALVDEFTVQGAIYYFGWLFGMSNKQIAAQFTFLSALLQLPPDNKFIRDLSGGQQRRVSFAVALVQTPELLILDEPTVGLDPVLRQNIWDYLVEISRDRNMTVIITTHYIEEARQAHKIGLMREGTLLAETSPSKLIAQHNCSTLEEVFLILSRRQGAGESFRNRMMDVDQEDDSMVLVNPDKVHKNGVNQVDFDAYVNKPLMKKIRPRGSLLLRMKAQLYKNFLRILRNTGGLFFLFFFPLIEIAAFFIAIGGDPHGLRLGVVNDEMGDCSAYSGPLSNYSGVELLDGDFDSCHFYGLSCLYMSKLSDDTTINIYYDSVEKAKAGTRSGKNLGVIYFPGNFSESLSRRQEEGKDAPEEVIEWSEVSVWLDMSNDQIGNLMKKHLLDKYIEVAEDLALGCNVSIKIASTPMLFNDPVLGSKEPSFALFMAPGMIISMVFFLSLTLTTTVIIIEKNEGLWDRNLVAGVSTSEILMCHLIVQCCCMVVQMTETLLLGFFVFNMQCMGSIVAVLVLVLLQALAGVAFGLLISVLCKDLTTANYASLGSFYPYILLSGLMWPLEGMPPTLRFISNALPGTWATTALRNVLDRGWGTLHPQVWPGFVISFIWIVLLCALCFVLMRRQKK